MAAVARPARPPSLRRPCASPSPAPADPPPLHAGAGHAPHAAAPLLERVVSALATAAWRVCADAPSALAAATELAPVAPVAPVADEPSKRPRPRPARSPPALASDAMIAAEPASPASPARKKLAPPSPALARGFGAWIRGAAAALDGEEPPPPPPNPPPNPPTAHGRGCGYGSSSGSSVASTPFGAEGPTALQHAAHALAEVLAHVLNARCWDAAFSRGARPGAPNRPVTRFSVNNEAPPRVRRLATEHLSAVQADGWNVLIGAMELARYWALPNLPARMAGSVVALNRPTRMRLAVCLATSWHFQRGHGSSRFPRDYCHGEGPKGPAVGDWSFELARVGYLFLTAEERALLGPWPTAYVVPLQNELMAMQVALVVGAPVFSLLTENPQVEAEHRLHQLFTESRIASHIALRARALVPLVLRVAWLVDGACRYVTLMVDTPLSIASGALACTGWMLQLSSSLQAQLAARCFTEDELCLAIALLSVMAATPARQGALTGCCADPLVPAARFATPGAAERALRLASAAAEGEAVARSA